MMESFDVWVEFSNGDSIKETHTGGEELFSALDRLTRGPAAMGGLITEVKVVDMLDCTNFLWQKGKIVYPTREDCELR